MSDDVIDVIIVGAGIIGLSVARALCRERPGIRVTILDKEPVIASHQTGRNSGVIHSGIYYRPGSLKARFAVRGAREIVEFAQHHGIDHEVCGKVIVATRSDELAALETLHERGIENGVPNTRLGPEELHEREPYCAGIAALHVPSTGIIDYMAVCNAMLDLARDGGTELRLGATVESIENRGSQVVVRVADEELRAGLLINCGGLYSDRLSRVAGADTDVQIIPFRGEYFTIRPERRHLVRDLIYPVPNPAFPFLGVHFTRMIDGELEAGPNAVLALAREGYRRRDIEIADLRETLRFPGMRVLAKKYWREGAAEMFRSFSKRAFVHALARLVPEIEIGDLERAPAGVRAQAVRTNGELLDDFAIADTGRVLNVLNAPSPAATASLPIGDHIGALAVERLDRND